VPSLSSLFSYLQLLLPIGLPMSLKWLFLEFISILVNLLGDDVQLAAHTAMLRTMMFFYLGPKAQADYLA
jgi:Na+-driven multidrug efflux pump